MPMRFAKISSSIAIERLGNWQPLHIYDLKLFPKVVGQSLRGLNETGAAGHQHLPSWNTDRACVHAHPRSGSARFWTSSIKAASTGW